MYLVVGANGQLGHELKLLLGENAVYADREELDITDENAVKAFCNSHNFQAIVNCAAYTAVDKAEENADVVEKINVLGPRNLAQTGIPIIHISTELLFDACTAFGLLTGFENWGGAKFAREQIEQISRAFRVDALADKISKKEKYMDEEKRKSIIAIRRKAKEMNDEQAEAVLSALLKGV